MKKIIIALISIIGFGCTPKREMPPVYFHESSLQSAVAARLHATEISGEFREMLPTGSMEPYLHGGDYVVIDLRFPYEKIEVGMIALYQARWLPQSSPPVCHWVAAKLSDQWVMDGSANKAYENTGKTAMGRVEFRGKVVAVYRTQK